MLRRLAATDAVKTTAKRASRPVAAVVVASALLVGNSLSGASAAEGDSVEDLRGGVRTVSEVRAGLDELAAAESILRANIAEVERSLNDYLSRRDQMSDESQRLTNQIETATRDIRRLAVTAYVSGGSAGEIGSFLDIEGAADVSWRNYLLTDRAQATDDLAVHLAELRAAAGTEVIRSIDAADHARSELAELQVEVDDVVRRQSELRSELLLAEAWDRVAIAVEQGPYGIAPMDQWEKLRFCESSDNYGALNFSGKYRGAYQFDYATWETVGGTGDPAAASPAEQDARARELYAWRGHSPWPECGRFLPGGSS